MTKTEMAEMTHRLQFLENVNRVTKESLISLLQDSFSAIATMDPTLGLSVLDQLNDQRDQIEALKKERDEHHQEYVKMLASNLESTIELEDE
jgi:hypothetical protein